MSVIKDFVNDIKKSVLLRILVEVFSTFGLGFASFFFHKHDLELYKIMLIWAISPLASLPVVIFSNTWNIRKFLTIGLLSFTAMNLSLLFYNQFSYILFGIFNGIALGYFWVSNNYIFFLKSTNAHHAKNMSINFALGPLIGIVIPPIGAILIDSFNFKLFFLLTSVLSLVPLLYMRNDFFNHTMKQSFREADKAFSGLRLVAFFNGALHFFQGNFLAIYVLLYLKTEYEISGMLSYLALMSLIVSFGLAYASDKYEKRTTILYPLLFIMALLIILIPALKTLPGLITVIGIYAIFDNLSLPIRFAAPMDVVKPDIGFWRCEEVWGNLGRTIVFVIAAVLVYSENYWAAFGIFAIMTAVFPFIISFQINSLKNSLTDSV